MNKLKLKSNLLEIMKKGYQNLLQYYSKKSRLANMYSSDINTRRYLTHKPLANARGSDS